MLLTLKIIITMKYLILSFAILCSLLVRGQILQNDSIDVYRIKSNNISATIKQLMEYEDSCTKNKGIMLSRLKIGVLFIDSVGKNCDKIMFYYDNTLKHVYKGIVENAWGICYIDSIPIMLKGEIDNRFCLKENVRVPLFDKMSGNINGVYDPFFRRLIIMFDSKEAE